MRPSTPLALAAVVLLAACGSTDDGGDGSPGGGCKDADDGRVTLVADDLRWDTDCLRAPPGALTIEVDNRDEGQNHNVHLPDRSRLAGHRSRAGPVAAGARGRPDRGLLRVHLRHPPEHGGHAHGRASQPAVTRPIPDRPLSGAVGSLDRWPRPIRSSRSRRRCAPGSAPRSRRPTPAAGAGLAGHRRRRAHADPGAHRLGQDAVRLPVGHRPARQPSRRRPSARTAPGIALRVAAAGAGGRRREEPAQPAAGHPPRGRAARPAATRSRPSACAPATRRPTSGAASSATRPTSSSPRPSRST